MFLRVFGVQISVVSKWDMVQKADKISLDFCSVKGSSHRQGAKGKVIHYCDTEIVHQEE
jgi:hypothetical protein